MSDMAVPYSLHRVTVEEYHRMDEADARAISHAGEDEIALLEFPDILMRVAEIVA